MEQNRIVIFGKGGVGKSTFASNLSMHYATQGRSVLHVGCDPKSDSTLFLVKNLESRQTVMSLISTWDKDLDTERLFNPGRLGVVCIEAGGPEAGIGCGGRGIARVLEFLESRDVFHSQQFDVVIFDVLGDVVCGGFAAPLRKGFGNKVVIVSAEDEMSYFAANNIARAVLRYRTNGVALLGLVLNTRGLGKSNLSGEDFASRIKTGILGRLPECEAMAEARRKRITMVEHDPEAPFSRAVATIADRIYEMDPDTVSEPAPFNESDFMRMSIEPGPPYQEPNAQCEQPLAPTRREQKTSAPFQAPPSSILIDRFSQLLGFTGNRPALPGIRLLDIEPDDSGAILLSVESPSLGHLEISLAPSGSGKSQTSTRNFDILLDADVLTAPAARLLQKISHRLGDFTLENLSVLHRRLNRQDGGRSGGPGPALQGGAESPHKWSQFFATHQFHRNMGQMVQYKIPHAQILHRDMECIFATPPIKANEFSLYNYPWLPERIGPHDPGQNAGSRSYETGLTETDIIMGDRSALAEIIDSAIDNIEGQDLLVFNNTCVPVVAGEDVHSAVKAAAVRCPVPVMYEGPENSLNIYPLESFFIQQKNTTGFADADTIARSLNIIGFPESRAAAELIGFLKGGGITINTRFLPGIDMQIFQAYRAGALSVVYPLPAFMNMFEKILSTEPVKHIAPTAPYGLRNTMQWLDAIGNELGMDETFFEAIQFECDRLKCRWDAITEAAREFRLGFVGDALTLKKLQKPKHTYAVPMLDVITEIGFEIEYFIYQDPLTGASNQVAEGTSQFSTREEMQRLLKESGCHCMYSDFAADARLAAAGKSQFSLQYFEMGLRGAIRTAERLLHSCKNPFFARYNKYFHPAG